MTAIVATTAGVALALCGMGALTSCNKSQSPQSTPSTGEASRTSNADQPPQRNPDRNPYYGEEHIHTSWSVDAWIFGNRITGPDDAYKYARGQTIKHPQGYDINI